MRILFVHQNFPGQYLHIVQRLARQGGHQLVALGINPLDPERRLPEALNYFRYSLSQGNTQGVHRWVMEMETKPSAEKAALGRLMSSRPKDSPQT